MSLLLGLMRLGVRQSLRRQQLLQQQALLARQRLAQLEQQKTQLEILYTLKEQKLELAKLRQQLADKQTSET